MDPETNYFEREPFWKSPVGRVLVVILAIAFLGGITSAVMLLRPKSSDRPMSRTEPSWMEFHNSINAYIKDKKVDLLFVGSTMTIGFAQDPGEELWYAYYGKRNVFNIGVPGDQTQNILWRMQNGNLEGYQPKTIVVMAGTENILVGQPVEEVVKGARAVVTHLQNRFPEAEIFLMGLPPVGFKNDTPSRSIGNATNVELKRFAEANDRISFFDISKEYLNEDGTINKDRMSDSMHLTREGYQVWATAIEKSLIRSLNR